jgi:hypothetical protein
MYFGRFLEVQECSGYVRCWALSAVVITTTLKSLGIIGFKTLLEKVNKYCTCQVRSCMIPGAVSMPYYPVRREIVRAGSLHSSIRNGARCANRHVFGRGR